MSGYVSDVATRWILSRTGSQLLNRVCVANGVEGLRRGAGCAAEFGCGRGGTTCWPPRTRHDCHRFQPDPYRRGAISPRRAALPTSPGIFRRRSLNDKLRHFDVVMHACTLGRRSRAPRHRQFLPRCWSRRRRLHQLQHIPAGSGRADPASTDRRPQIGIPCARKRDEPAGPERRQTQNLPRRAASGLAKQTFTSHEFPRR